jgi:hypothetical protein
LDFRGKCVEVDDNNLPPAILTGKIVAANQLIDKVLQRLILTSLSDEFFVFRPDFFFVYFGGCFSKCSDICLGDPMRRCGMVIRFNVWQESFIEPL